MINSVASFTNNSKHTSWKALPGNSNPLPELRQPYDILQKRVACSDGSGRLNVRLTAIYMQPLMSLLLKCRDPSRAHWGETRLQVYSDGITLPLA